MFKTLWNIVQCENAFPLTIRLFVTKGKAVNWVFFSFCVVLFGKLHFMLVKILNFDSLTTSSHLHYSNKIPAFFSSASTQMRFPLCESAYVRKRNILWRIIWGLYAIFYCAFKSRLWCSVDDSWNMWVSFIKYLQSEYKALSFLKSFQGCVCINKDSHPLTVL